MTTLLKEKSAVGTTWAGRVLHQQTHTPAPLVSCQETGALSLWLPRSTLTHSVKTNQALPQHIYPVDATLDLLVYADASALFVEKGDPARVLPVLLYLPERVTINKKKHCLSPRDIVTPGAAFCFEKYLVPVVTQLFHQDVQTLAKKARAQALTGTPWFMAADHRTEQDTKQLSLLFYGLETLGLETFTVKGRILKPDGTPGHLRVEQKRYSSACSITEAPALRAMMAHPAFPVPVVRQVHQGWDYVRSGKEEASFTGMPLYDTKTITSAHDTLQALTLATQTLAVTQTTLDDLNKIW